MVCQNILSCVRIKWERHVSSKAARTTWNKTEIKLKQNNGYFTRTPTTMFYFSFVSCCASHFRLIMAKLIKSLAPELIDWSGQSRTTFWVGRQRLYWFIVSLRNHSEIRIIPKWRLAVATTYFIGWSIKNFVCLFSYCDAERVTTTRWRW